VLISREAANSARDQLTYLWCMQMRRAGANVRTGELEDETKVTQRITSMGL